MVTNSKDYIDQLWNIQNQASTKKAILLPKNEDFVHINLDTRKIEMPKSFTIVSQDHVAETVYFTFDRYYDNVDLTTMIGAVLYTNANGEEFIQPFPFFDRKTLASEGKVIAPWEIQNSVTKYAGPVKFAVKFFRVNSDKILMYDLNTLPAETIIQRGQDGGLELPDNKVRIDSSWYELIEEFKKFNELNLYWIDA